MQRIKFKNRCILGVVIIKGKKQKKTKELEKRVFGPVDETWGIAFDKLEYISNNSIKGEISLVKQRLITNSGVIYERKIWGTTRMFLETVPDHALEWYAVSLKGFNKGDEKLIDENETLKQCIKDIMEECEVEQISIDLPTDLRKEIEKRERTYNVN